MIDAIEDNTIVLQSAIDDNTTVVQSVYSELNNVNARLQHVDGTITFLMIIILFLIIDKIFALRIGGRKYVS